MLRIALEGGGARSAFSSGVLSALYQSGLPISSATGSSSGSLNAAFLASHQIDHLCELWSDPRFTPRLIRWERFLNPFAGPGIDVDALCFEMLEPDNEIDLDALFTSDIKCYFTLTDVEANSGLVVEPDRENFYQWLCAAMAIPVAYNRIVAVGERRFADGGILEPIPFDVPLPDPSVEARETHTVAIITRPLSVDKPRPSFWQRALIDALVPLELRDTVRVQHEHHNRCLARIRAAQAAGTLQVIAPPEDMMPVSRLTRDPAKLASAVALGRDVGARWLDEHARRLKL